MQKKLAIIGASSGQLPLVRKAKEMGLHTVCFAWEKGAVCKDECDEYYPISIFDTEAIVEVCRRLKVDGVVSTASEETARVVAEVASKLNLRSNNPDNIIRIQDKGMVREMTKDLDCLVTPQVWTEDEIELITFPCIVKPVTGSAKRGVSYCENHEALEDALAYARTLGRKILIEEFIPGDEFAIESLSYKGKHQVVQITRKINSGIPHFVEMELHQSPELWEELHEIVEPAIASILDCVGFTDGASHIEVKIKGNKLCLIEINPRGAGDRTDALIPASTDCDFLRGMIDISLDTYKSKQIHRNGYSGILFLTAQTAGLLKYFDDKEYEWMIERVRLTTGPRLTESKGNYERDGYIIYKSSKPLVL